MDEFSNELGVFEFTLNDRVILLFSYLVILSIVANLLLFKESNFLNVIDNPIGSKSSF